MPTVGAQGCLANSWGRGLVDLPTVGTMVALPALWMGFLAVFLSMRVALPIARDECCLANSWD